VYDFVRSIVPTLTTDRPPSPDIEAIAAAILSGAFERSCGAEVK
jgi:histidine ammonia-lyase